MLESILWWNHQKTSFQYWFDIEKVCILIEGSCQKHLPTHWCLISRNPKLVNWVIIEGRTRAAIVAKIKNNQMLEVSYLGGDGTLHKLSSCNLVRFANEIKSMLMMVMKIRVTNLIIHHLCSSYLWGHDDDSFIKFIYTNRTALISIYLYIIMVSGFLATSSQERTEKLPVRQTSFRSQHVSISSFHDSWISLFSVNVIIVKEELNWILMAYMDFPGSITLLKKIIICN